MNEAFYVYALKDPTRNPAVAFYIGKGTGTRAWDHLVRIDGSAKGRRIHEIQEKGFSVIVAVLAESLTESQAVKLEAELISAFGTEATGGLLTNSIIPTGEAVRTRRGLVIPSGVREKASIGMALLKEAIVELAKANREGITNADAAKALGLGRLRRDESLGKGRHVCTVP
jgi:hypothetical protein